MFMLKRSQAQGKALRGRARRRMAAPGLGLEALEVRRLMATRTWSGEFGANWNDPNNWNEFAVPVANDDLVFPVAAVNRATNNDLPGAPTFRTITITGPNYSLSGGTIGLSTGLTAASSASINLTIGLDNASANVPIHVADGATLNFNAAIFSAVNEGLTLNPDPADTGQVAINTATSYAGPTEVQHGVLALNGGGRPGDTSQGTTIDSGATLSLSLGEADYFSEPLTLSGDGFQGMGALAHPEYRSVFLYGSIDLAADATINELSAAMYIDGTIGGAGGITKIGSGQLELRNTNTYAGTTRVLGGSMNLGSQGGGAIPGDLVIGDGTSGVSVTLEESDQISDTASVTIGEGSSLRFQEGPYSSPTETIGSLDLTGATVDASGNSMLRLNGDVTVHPSLNPSQIAGPLDLGAATRIFDVDDGPAAFNLILSGPIAGAGGGIDKFGAGTFLIAGSGTYTGATTVDAGTLLVDGNIATSATARANGAATLGGGGTLPATVLGPFGILAPGDSPGIITTGDVSYFGYATLSVQIDGSTVGTQYDSQVVNGTVILNLGDYADATLLVDLNAGYTPDLGTTFTIIDNDGTDPVIGHLSGLPEGGTFTSGGQLFRISYVGGTGNDVVLSAVATTTTTVGASPNPSTFGQAVTFSTTVTSTGGTPTGDVALVIDGTTVETVALNPSGVADFTPIKTLVAGAHTIRVDYAGDAQFVASNGTLDGGQVVHQATTTANVASSRDPSIVGQPITFTATVIGPGGAPTGSVSLLVDGLTVQTVELGVDGTASFDPIDTMAIGNHAIDVSYAGDLNDLSAEGSLAGGQVVRQAGTAVAVAAGPSNLVHGQPVLLFARVFGQFGIPRGKVEFFDGEVSLGVGQLGANGQATLRTSNLAIGHRTITATYLGDVDFAASTAATPASVTVAKSTPRIAFAASSTATVFGENLWLRAWTAAPYGTTPTGTVSFFDGAGGIFLGSATLENGVATVKAPVLGLGTHTIRAVFNGNTLFNPVTSSIVSVTVSPAATALTVLPNPAQAVVGRPYQFRVAVRAASPGSGTPFGQVEVLLNGTRSAVIDLNASGQGSTFLTPTTAGSWTVGFRYLGSKYDTAGATPTTTTVQVLPASMMPPPPGGPMPLLARGRTTRSS